MDANNTPMFGFFPRFKAHEHPYAWLKIFKRSGDATINNFILGADDPEMSEIEIILKENGKTPRFATKDGKRVHPGNAYEADPVHFDKGPVVLIECGPVGVTTAKHFLKEEGGVVEILIIDHHKFGDYGFGLPPEKFWEASSIGQLYKMLHLGEPTKERLILAAMDHCMVKARQGKCPGVDPEHVKHVSREFIAKRNGVPMSVVELCIEEMGMKISAAPKTLIGKQEVADLRSLPVGVGYSLEYLCTQEALADRNLAALVTTKNNNEGMSKVIIYGAATPHTIESFISFWAKDHGLIDPYGVPARGFAGAYHKH